MRGVVAHKPQYWSPVLASTAHIKEASLQTTVTSGSGFLTTNFHVETKTKKLGIFVPYMQHSQGACTSYKISPLAPVT